MKYLVAVSGGVDSVVLLDMLVKEAGHQLVVAHFDHGIRDDSAADARFVEALADRHELPFVGKREELGKDASEELARSRRYLFLGEEALKREAKIVTAHHQNDVLETVAINLSRGTGWRGLAVLSNEHIVRPFLDKTKQEILRYALDHRLEWVEDCTNSSDAYLRNRLRFILNKRLDTETHRQLIELWRQQVMLRREIEGTASSFISMGSQSRHFFIQIDDKVGEELLREYSEISFGWSPTRPQLKRALVAIKTARPGSKFPFGKAWLLVNKTDFSFSVKTP